MIISHKHRFIFVKNRKTAGTSVEVMLSRHLGPLDVATPLSHEDEALRLVNDTSPQNWGAFRLDIPKLKKLMSTGDDGPAAALQKVFSSSDTNNVLKNRDWTPAGEFFSFKSVFYNHMPAEQIRSLVPPFMWDGYTKFCIERHPYEKAVSQASRKVQKSRKANAFADFATALDHCLETESFVNWHIYSDRSDRILVDRIIRMEELDEALPKLLGGLGLENVGSLPKAKGQTRTDPRPASEILTPAQKKRIQEIARKEFEYFKWPT